MPNRKAVASLPPDPAADAARAAKLFTDAASAGNADAQYNLAILYDKGRGVNSDLAAAAKWFGEAAKGGAKDADAARQARARLAALPKDYQVGPEDVTAFEGRRFVLRRATSAFSPARARGSNG